MASVSQNKMPGDEEEHLLVEKEEAFSYALKLCSYSVLPMTIYTAIEMGLFRVIYAAGPGAQLTAEEISSGLDATSPLAPLKLERILRLLASYSIFTCSTSVGNDGRNIFRYGVAPVCQYLTPNEDGVCLAPLALLSCDRVSLESWYHLKDAILDGGVAFNRAHGQLTEFEYHAIDPRFSKVFNEGMRSHSIMLMNNILTVYDGFKDVNILVDVCGGTGGALSIITTKHPHIKGINFDLPHVISQAPPLPRVEHVGGDVFESIPNGEALFLKWILHDWNDEECIKILKNCWKALPDDGKVIVVELLLPEIPDSTNLTHCVLHCDAMMLLETPSGRERTEKELRVLAQESGFSAFEVVCNFSGSWIMELTK